MDSGIKQYSSELFIILLILLLSINWVASVHTEEGLELLFRERSQSDWENVWHHETHSRCRDKLLRQLYWACEKDIYRLTRRNDKRSNESWRKNDKKFRSLSDLWLRPEEAHLLIRTRRSHISSITNECCTKIGCTWEEYAEYCPSNKRRNHY